MIYLDLDNFKIINDSFGHSVGDRFLYNVVKNIKGNLRKADIVVRLGGDEFAILLLEHVPESDEIIKALRNNNPAGYENKVLTPIIYEGVFPKLYKE